MIFIQRIHQEGGLGHQHIAEYEWRNPADGKVGRSSRDAMIDWLVNQKGEAKVTDGRNTVDVMVVDTKPPYLRTRTDRTWTDNLLALPRY